MAACSSHPTDFETGRFDKTGAREGVCSCSSSGKSRNRASPKNGRPTCWRTILRESQSAAAAQQVVQEEEAKERNDKSPKRSSDMHAIPIETKQSFSAKSRKRSSDITSKSEKKQSSMRRRPVKGHRRTDDDERCADESNATKICRSKANKSSSRRA